MFGRGEDIIESQEQFSVREVGITHPDNPGFIRICDNGDIEIMAGDGLSIVMNSRSRSISFVADSIKFITKKDGGLKWNRLTFNEKATGFSQPTFLTIDEREALGVYRGVDYFTQED